MCLNLHWEHLEISTVVLVLFYGHYAFASTADTRPGSTVAKYMIDGGIRALINSGSTDCAIVLLLSVYDMQGSTAHTRHQIVAVFQTRRLNWTYTRLY